MAQTWNDSTLPWQTWDGTNLVYKDPSMPWNNTDLPWKADSNVTPVAGTPTYYILGF